MTERLYYTDPAAREFDATIVSVEREGERALLRLDRSAFYPTSGGQPFDTGTLNGVAVVDVIDHDDRGVAHIVSPGNWETGQAVRGVIDWTRRFDHMQQHSGQHVLSAAFDRLFGVATVSFHLGADASTIDLARDLTPSEIVRAEDEANRIIWDDRPVAIRFVSPEEAARLPLRKEPAREGRLRLIDIEDFDLSACGGTHVARTGVIGMIAIGSVDRFKGGQRVEFFCGGRALGRFRALRETTTASVRLLSVSAADMPAAIERLQEDLKERRRAQAVLQTELAHYKAEELIAGAETIAGGRLVVRSVDLDATGLKTLASAITAGAGFTVALASAGRPALIVIARSKDGTVRANEVIAALTARFGGRGGGKPDLAQAGGLDASIEELLAEARRLVSA